jgi:uncharacterized protein (TIGR02453 family)
MGFNSEFLKFFKELEQNNNKEWFHNHKKVYEEYVKIPFKNLLDEMILRIHGEDPDLDIESKSAIFRINRDIRFSKDKTPYKTFVSANIAKGGRKSFNSPGFYIHFSHNSAVVAGGIHQPDKDGLYKIRKKIVGHREEFSKLLENPDFKKRYGSIRGEKNKRITKEFEEAAKTEPLIANKQFFYWAEVDPEIILKPNLSDILMEYYHAGKTVNDFLKEALNN